MQNLLTRRRLVLFASALVLTLSFTGAPTVLAATTIGVPADYSTIQAAINAAQDGDIVLVAPDTYNENLTISGKTITLASEFYNSGNPSDISSTIIDGGGSGAVITVDASVGPDTSIIGFTIRNATDGILPYGKFNLLNNIIGQGEYLGNMLDPEAQYLFRLVLPSQAHGFDLFAKSITLDYITSSPPSMSLVIKDKNGSAVEEQPFYIDITIDLPTGIEKERIERIEIDFDDDGIFEEIYTQDNFDLSADGLQQTISISYIYHDPVPV